MNKINRLLLAIAMIATAIVANAQGKSKEIINIKLPAPNMNLQTLSVMQTLQSRKSVREYSDESLSEQALSNLCWAACGMSRDKDHRTAPTARNCREITLYVFDKGGVYKYLPVKNELEPIVYKDCRDLMAGKAGGFKQDFAAQAPVSLLMVIEFDKLGSKDTNAMMMGCVDAGIVCENINLFCAASGLATVPRATMDVEGIKKMLRLSDNELPIMNNPVGYPRK